MEKFRLFWVNTASSRPGKHGEAAKWWRETGQAFFESLPGVKSLQVFAVQFNLGRRPNQNYEFWFEFDDYAVLDKWDEDIMANPEKHGPPNRKFRELFEWGPSRFMGDWPESLID